MIYPSTLYNFCKSCTDSAMIGNVLRALCGQDVELSVSEEMLYKMIANDNKWMDERLEAKKERVAARQRKLRERKSDEQEKDEVQNDTESCENEQLSPEASGSVTLCHASERDKRYVTQDGVTKRDTTSEVLCHATECDKTLVTQDGVTKRLSRPLPSLLPSSLPPSLTSSTNINRSVPVPLPPKPKSAPKQGENGNENGTVKEILVKGGLQEARKRAWEAAEAIRKDEGAFFTGEHSALSFILAMTGDYKSINRWQQLVKAKGESAICEELFTFYREIKSGEDVKNRGAALNKRLSDLPDWSDKSNKQEKDKE